MGQPDMMESYHTRVGISQYPVLWRYIAFPLRNFYSYRCCGQGSLMVLSWGLWPWPDSDGMLRKADEFGFEQCSPIPVDPLSKVVFHVVMCHEGNDFFFFHLCVFLFFRTALYGPVSQFIFLLRRKNTKNIIKHRILPHRVFCSKVIFWRIGNKVSSNISLSPHISLWFNCDFFANWE